MHQRRNSIEIKEHDASGHSKARIRDVHHTQNEHREEMSNGAYNSSSVGRQAASD
jgi:hypothetical protein